MDSKRWQSIEALFFAALDLPAEDRAAYLDEACGEDGDLRAEVEAVLSKVTRGQELRIEGRLRSLNPERPQSADEPAGATLPDRVGIYQIVRPIGSGGMGRVFLARRDDDQYAQDVALKVVRSDFGGLDLADRFRAERQILAQLQHPHIAALLDGGVTEDGRPFLAMQFVDGLPIDEYADEHGLTIRDRLALFATVCDTVQFAHSNLVVHRDLKPSNILVDQEGLPRLLDFGIAKILEGGPDVPEAVTEAGGLLTPEHAAPEQIQGGPITTSTDVYALGILLYELLTGGRPFRAAGAAPSEFYRKVLDDPPPRPSHRVMETMVRASDSDRTGIAALRGTGPAMLVQSLRGDLDQIVLKALRKEPSRRYESAGQLATDVRRYLAGRPVIAQPDTVGYRTRKFVARNRVGVTLSTAVLALVLGLAVTMTVQSARVTAERDRTQLALDRAQEVSAFLEGLFEASDPNVEPERLTVLEVLDRGAERLDELSGQPEVQAQMLTAVGRAYWGLAQYPRAEPLLQRALELRREAHGSVHEDVAESLNALALLRVDQRASPDGVEPLYRELIDIYSELDGAGSRRVANMQVSLAALDFMRRDLDAAENGFRDALAILRTDDSARVAVADALNNLGLTLIRKGELEEAETLLQESLAINRVERGEDHPTVATNLNILADALHAQGKFDEAEPVFRDVLARREATFGSEHPAVANALVNLALVLMGLDRATEGVPLAERAIEIQRVTQGSEHPLLAQSLRNLGRLHMAGAAYDRAEPHLLESMRIARANGTDHPQVGRTRAALEELYLAWGREDEAARYREGGA